jgi:Asp-tRNA(Asn)/Glu-tRNA(Gln) amidotransferase A subunit family amidase
LIYGRDLNATTQEFFDEALDAAKKSDERRSRGESIRLLEGIPISIKDCYGQKDADSFCGLASMIGHPLNSDCSLLRILREAGEYPSLHSN